MRQLEQIQILLSVLVTISDTIKYTLGLKGIDWASEVS